MKAGVLQALNASDHVASSSNFDSLSSMDDYETAGATTTQTTIASHSSQKVVISVPTRNTYAVLTDSQKDVEEELKIKKTRTQKDRIPPISIIGKSRMDVINICNDLGLKKYFVKITSKGVNLYFNDVDEYMKARKHFSSNKYPSFTHDLHSEKQFRVVLKGLFKMDIDEIKHELELNNIKPIEVKEMVVKKRKYDDQANYLLYFTKGSTNIAFLNKCKHLFHIRVEFEQYFPQKYGPIRCRNCQMWGHGAKNCNLPTACMFCAGNHQTDDCKYVIQGRTTPDYVPKCKNCDGAHSSNFNDCPSLLEYKKLQEAITLKNSTKNKRTTHREPLKTTNTTTQKYNNQSPTYASITRNGYNSTLRINSNEQLLSPQEMIQLTREMIAIYKNCKTREQQFNAISELAIKYVYGHGP